MTHYEDRDLETSLKYLVLSSLILRLLKVCKYEIGTDDMAALEIIHEVIQIHDVNTHPILALDGDEGSNCSQVGLTKVFIDLGIQNHS